VVSVITVPVLLGVEIIACVFHVRRLNLGQARMTLLLFVGHCSSHPGMPRLSLEFLSNKLAEGTSLGERQVAALFVLGIRVEAAEDHPRATVPPRP
jgi:hypothetical protein